MEVYCNAPKPSLVFPVIELIADAAKRSGLSIPLNEGVE